MSGAPSVGGSWSLLPPEITARASWRARRGLRCFGGGNPADPRHRVGAEHGGHPTTAAAAAGAAVIALSTLVFGWVRVREDVHAWWRKQMDAAFPDKDKDEEPAGA